MSWDLTGQRVRGTYLGLFDVTGTVEETRVAYGGRLKHSLKLDQPITVYGAVRDVVILEENELEDIIL